MDNLSLGKVNIMNQTSNKEQHIMLWHQQLGHPSVNYMKHLFLSMLSKLDKSKFRYQTCTLVKSHCVSYPTNSNKSCVPFALVHFDI